MSIRLASLGIFSIQRENPGGAPVIKIIHVVDQRIKIPLLFQIKIIGEKFFVKINASPRVLISAIFITEVIS